MKSTIEIKTAFEGCAEVCELFQLDYNSRENQCMGIKSCEKVREALAKLYGEPEAEQTAENPLDDLFADSLDKLDGLGVEE